MDSLDHCECAVIALVLTHYLAAAIRYRPQQLSSTTQPVSGSDWKFKSKVKVQQPVFFI